MSLAAPSPAPGPAHRERELTPAEQANGDRRPPPPDRVGRPARRHEPDCVLLFVVVALTAVGILMVYSSSAIRGYLSNKDRSPPSARRSVGGCSASSLMLLIMRIDYRYLRAGIGARTPLLPSR